MVRMRRQRDTEFNRNRRLTLTLTRIIQRLFDVQHDILSARRAADSDWRLHLRDTVRLLDDAQAGMFLHDFVREGDDCDSDSLVSPPLDLGLTAGFAAGRHGAGGGSRLAQSPRHTVTVTHSQSGSDSQGLIGRGGPSPGPQLPSGLPAGPEQGAAAATLRLSAAACRDSADGRPAMMTGRCDTVDGQTVVALGLAVPVPSQLKCGSTATQTVSPFSDFTGP
eukprot:753032-Hanusia_phi.AAC.1